MGFHGLLSDSVSEPEVPADGRILFRKPNKRSSDGPQGKDRKKLKDSKYEESSVNKSKKVKKKAHQDKKLLSFNEDEEEEEC